MFRIETVGRFKYFSKINSNTQSRPRGTPEGISLFFHANGAIYGFLNYSLRRCNSMTSIYHDGRWQTLCIFPSSPFSSSIAVIFECELVLIETKYLYTIYMRRERNVYCLRGKCPVFLYLYLKIDSHIKRTQIEMNVHTPKNEFGKGQM